MRQACDCHERGSAWCGERPSFECEAKKLSRGDFLGWDELFDAYAHACPDRQLLEDLVAMGPIVELGAGKGYWARLLRDLGADVVAVDDGSWSDRQKTWTDVTRGTERVSSDFPGRALLLCMPPRPGSGRMMRAFQGRRMVVVTEGPFPNPEMVFGDGERDAVEAVAEGGWRVERMYPLRFPDRRHFVGAYIFVRQG